MASVKPGKGNNKCSVSSLPYHTMSLLPVVFQGTFKWLIVCS